MSGSALAPTASLRRRLAAFVYEGVLVFGIATLAALVYGVATEQRHALIGSGGLQAVIFGVLGAYFVYWWSRSGQTLAMLTWRIRLLTVHGQPVGPWRALVRYLLSWMWFLPALATLHLAGLKGGWPATVVVLTGVLAYAALARLHPDRQFLHDAICGTRLVSWQRPRPGREALVG